MTAEFAIVLPAVLLVLLLAISSIMLATQRMTLSSAAAELARLEARGDTSAASAVLDSLTQGQLAGVSVQRSASGPLHCVTLRTAPMAGLLAGIEVSGRGCAARITAQ